jgi:hypothetical protein
MLGIALVQGLGLLFLYRSVESGFWPSGAPRWSLPLWTLTVAVPVLLLLSLTRDNASALFRYIGGFAAVLALLGLYTGWQAEPFHEFPIGSMIGLYAITLGIACFKALMYLQQRAGGESLSYRLLFTYSWRNFLVSAFSGLFTLIFWLILLLWSRLFSVIGIDFFKALFSRDWFFIPLSAVVFGLGISVFRQLTPVIDNISNLLHWLIKLLLPLLLAVAVIFLSVLPFTGLDLLWGTGAGTALLLWLLAMSLFFTNAVYQDGREADPYPRALHRAIYSALCVMPVVALLSGYGLFLRVQQYGWTIERCWALVVWLVLSLFAVGYVFGILRRRDSWTRELARVNTGMGLVILAMMLLANSPVLDFRKLSLASQLARVESGDIRVDELDYWYVKNYLARPGYLAIEEIKAGLGEEDAELLAIINAPYRSAAVAPSEVDAFWKRMRYRPEAFDVPLDLRTRLERHANMALNNEPMLVEVDLDGDGEAEYLLLMTGEQGIAFTQFYFRDGSGWQIGDLRYRPPGSGDSLRDRLLEGDLSLDSPRFQNLRIGDIEFQPIARN